MSEYLHVEEPFLDQLSQCGWTVVNQDQGFIPNVNLGVEREQERQLKS